MKTILNSKKQGMIFVGLLMAMTPLAAPFAVSADYFFPSNMQFKFKVQGSQGVFDSPQVKVDRTLRVRISSEPLARVLDRAVKFDYSCASYQVTVGKVSKKVVLSVGSRISQECRDEKGNVAPSSVVLDFSKQLRKLDDDKVSVRISKPEYDFYCLRFGEKTFRSYCPTAPIYLTHQISGLVEIDTGIKKPVKESSCLDIRGPIGFEIQGAYWDDYRLLGGNIPFYAQSIGSSVISNSRVSGAFQAYSEEGMISMQVAKTGNQNPLPYDGLGTPYHPIVSSTASQVAVKGVLQVSADKVLEILFANGYPYGGYSNSASLCVSKVAIELYHSNSQVPYAAQMSGRVYLYLNGSATSNVSLQF